MNAPLDGFDRLCHSVFMSSSDAGTQSTASQEETALLLVSRAQVYELPPSYTPPWALTGAATEVTDSSLPSVKDHNRLCYRIHLETIADAAEQQDIRKILVDAMDPTLLLELPFDRNMTGCSSKTRTETRVALLELPVVLDMDGLASGTVATLTSEEAGLDTPAEAPLSADNQPSSNFKKTMLLFPTKEWLRLTGRIRFWRAESHRIKVAQREAVLDKLLNERWQAAMSTSATSHLLPATTSSCPPLSGPLTAADIPVSSPLSSASPSTVISPDSSLRSLTTPHISTLQSQSSPYRQPFQEHQLESLVQFMALYGNEPSVTSLLRGLFDLVRRQLTVTRVLAWTFDRANLTEQKPEATVAFLDLLARLGLELVQPNGKQTGRVEQANYKAADTLSKPTSATTSASAPLTSTGVRPSTSTTSESAAIGSRDVSTELTWTFGARIDDRRLEYWVRTVQQATLPVLRANDQSLLPSTATFMDSSNSNIASSLPLPNSTAQLKQDQGQQQNPISVTVRKRFLQDSNTIPAGTIHILSIAGKFSPTALSDTSVEKGLDSIIARDSSFVLTTSKYALNPSSTSASSSGLFVDRVKKDVKDLARWASTCGGRLDWIWAWLFSSFQKSRHRSSMGRRPRPNDENV
ncbi:hypothetical protein EDD11_004674 [Mortierella claussenii]|nr:hypothetical protein EDD11_004674 [Mortierella claussenii]